MFAGFGFKRKLCVLILVLISEIFCYEKTLRKIVRNQSKMVPRPFSENVDISMYNISQTFPNSMILPGYAQVKTVIHKMQRPKISTILSSVDTGRSKTTYSKMKVARSDKGSSKEPRSTKGVFDNVTNSVIPDTDDILFSNFDAHGALSNNSYSGNIALETYYHIPVNSKFFPHMEKQNSHNEGKENRSNIIPAFNEDDSKLLVKGIIHPNPEPMSQAVSPTGRLPKFSELQYDTDEKPDFVMEEVPQDNILSAYEYNISANPYICSVIQKSKADVDALKKFGQLDVEPTWISKKHFWNKIFNSRYEYLMRNHKWPSLKVILIPRTHVDSIWKRTFEEYYNDSVNKIISNIVKKLKFYPNLTFTWNEVSHLNQWWKNANQKNRSALRRLIRAGRLELTTGGWVETDEATTDLFGLIHLLTEGHQWLKNNINYAPKVAWLTNSVTHSPTMSFLLSAAGISKLIFTNIHYSWEKYLAEYQISDFIWIQDWDNDKSSPSWLNDALNKIGNYRLPKYSVLSHYLQFNSAGFKACGPNGDVCMTDYDFGKSNINLDIDLYNIKNKSETLLEQYSKTGTITPHNVIIAPIGGPYHYGSQTEIDYQYNNYNKIADFINTNSDIYKTSIQFGTPSDYFNAIIENQKSYPTLKGDFLNFADISSGSPAYWTGYYTSRPLLKISLRRLQSTLRTTELLFSFAISVNTGNSRVNVSNLSKLLIRSRETLARLQDRNIVSGTLTVNTLKYVNNQIASTARDCWHIQEVAASLLSARPGQNRTYLQKYVYRDGEFISTFRTVSVGDQIYIFNSLSHERTEVVELITRYPKIKIIDHNKKEVTIQLNPVWKYTSENFLKISKDYYRINFVIVLPPMTLELFKIKETYDTSQSASTVYCIDCVIDNQVNSGTIFPFSIQPIETGDIQLESYKHRLMFDEVTGFLKQIIEKETNIEKSVIVDYGAFKSADINAGMFLFNTNVSRPLFDILLPYRTGSKTKLMIITSGQVTTEVTVIYGRLLQHTVKIFNLMNSALSNAIYMESKIDLEVSPKNRELEVFLSVQSDIENGNHPEIYIDNNGFQYTPRIINITRRVESNMYPMSSMAFIQDKRRRLTIVTDHAQGVTALQEGQLVVMLDRRVLYNDGRGANEGLADSSVTCHRHFLLLENFVDTRNKFKSFFSNTDVVLPSLAAQHISNALNYIIDIYLIDKSDTDLCFYAFLPLVKSSFPCDVVVVNYRAIIDTKFEQIIVNSALLMLHRQSFTCLTDNALKHLCNGDPNFNLDKILRHAKRIYQTNIVGTTENVPISTMDHSNFPPMEIKTFRVYF